jgi:hypothetical protein
VGGIVEAMVTRLESLPAGLTVFANRRWEDPAPGTSVVVVTEAGLSATSRSTSRLQDVRVSIYSAPSADQIDADLVGLPVANLIEKTTHAPFNFRAFWGDLEILSCTLVGTSGPGEVEGTNFSVRSLTFEVRTSGNTLTAMLAQQARAQAVISGEEAAAKPKSQKFIESERWLRKAKRDAEQTALEHITHVLTDEDQLRRRMAVPTPPVKQGKQRKPRKSRAKNAES